MQTGNPMGGIVPSSIGDWLFFLAILIAIYLPSFIAVATERSGCRAGRVNYLVAFVVGLVGPVGIAALLDRLIGPSTDSRLFLAWVAVWLLFQIWFYRVLVRRARDAGYTRALAYSAVVPMVGLVICIYLLFPASKPSLPQVTT
jgi:uncharacterized membrane protein YhaH (DUF805 family)